MSGRIYKLRRITNRRSNYFSMDDYNNAASSISKAEPVFLDGQYAIKVRAKDKESLKYVKRIIEQLLEWNGAPKPKSYRLFNAVTNTELYRFGGAGLKEKKQNKANRDAALDIIEAFAVDRIYDWYDFGDDGSVTSSEGLKVKVDLAPADDDSGSGDDSGDDEFDKTNGGGSGKTNGGGSGKTNRPLRTNTGSSKTGSDTGTETETPWTRYALIGGVALVAIIAAVWYFKKKK